MKLSEKRQYIRTLKKLGVPYAVRIDMLRIFRCGDMPTLDEVCGILDKYGIAHDLRNAGYDDLERYNNRYYKGCWLNSETYLQTENFALKYCEHFI